MTDQELRDFIELHFGSAINAFTFDRMRTVLTELLDLQGEGSSGREVELQATGTHIQWRYAGDPSWMNLVALSAITGPAGSNATVTIDSVPTNSSNNAVSSDGVFDALAGKISVGETYVNADTFMVGDDAADNTAALEAYALTGKNVYMPRNRVYRLNDAEINSKSNWKIFGEGTVKATTTQNIIKIVGNTSDAVIKGIRFENNQTNTTENTEGLLTILSYSNGVNMSGIEIDDCYFTAPNYKTQGIKIIMEGATGALTDSSIHDCRFDGLGRMGLEVQNHVNDGLFRVENLSVHDNYFNNIGTVHSGNSVSAISISGDIYNTRVVNNDIWDVHTDAAWAVVNYGIENAGSVGFYASGNFIRSRNHGFTGYLESNTRNPDRNTIFTGNTINLFGSISNTKVRGMEIYNTKNGLFTGNNVRTTGYGVYLNAASENMLTGNTFISAEGNVLFATNGTTKNTITGNTFSSETQSGSNDQTVRFDGATVTGNFAYSNRLVRNLGNAGTYAQTNGATNNVVAVGATTDASQLTSGTLSTDRLPNVPSAKLNLKLFNVLDYGATGNGVANDATAIQAAATAAIAAQGTLYFPAPSAYYRVTSTISLVPPNGQTQFSMSIKGFGTNNNMIVWEGGNNDEVFQSWGWKNSVVSGINIRATNTHTGIVYWDLDTRTGIESTSNLKFENAWYDYRNTGCTGFRLGQLSQGVGDVSLITFDNLSHYGGQVNNLGVDQNNTAYLIVGGNTLHMIWRGGGWTGMSKGVTNINPLGGAGNGAWYLYGCGGSFNLLDFNPASGQTIVIDGGRWELGKRFLQTEWGGYFMNISVRGVEIDDYAPDEGKLVRLRTPVNLTFKNCNIFRPGQDYDINLFTAENNERGVINVENCSLHASDPFISIPALFRKRVRDCQKLSGIDVASWFTDA